MILTGSPSLDWTGLTGFVDVIHYIDTGVNMFQIKDNSDPRQPFREFDAQTRGLGTNGSIVIDEGRTAKSVESVKSETDPTSGLLHAPTVNVR